MRPCCEQEARDAIEDLGLVPDDDRTRTGSSNSTVRTRSSSGR